jgi:hypothetical protein
MIDSICIFTKFGVLLWHKSYIPNHLQLFNQLIEEVLIPEKATNEITLQGQLCKWKFDNELGLVVAVLASKLAISFETDSIIFHVRIIVLYCRRFSQDLQLKGGRRGLLRL